MSIADAELIKLMPKRRMLVVFLLPHEISISLIFNRKDSYYEK